MLTTSITVATDGIWIYNPAGAAADILVARTSVAVTGPVYPAAPSAAAYPSIFPYAADYLI